MIIMHIPLLGHREACQRRGDLSTKALSNGFSRRGFAANGILLWHLTAFIAKTGDRWTSRKRVVVM
jgi:hypothetical protein